MSLLTKYRPEEFDHVIGQDAAVRSLQGALEKKQAHTFLLTGPSGVGKTTLARLAAKAAGCKPQDIIEIDAATHTGVDDVREINDTLLYRPIGGGVKACVVDEAHFLSKNAWGALLKVLEEPPAWVLWFLCTTDFAKVPTNIKTRSLHLPLAAVPRRVLVELLCYVVAEEQVPWAEDEQLASEVIELCARLADGSPRQALSNLNACLNVTSSKEAVTLLKAVEATTEAFELARALVRGARWTEVQGLLQGLTEANPEGVRHVVRAYLTKVVLNAKSEQQAGRALEILDAFLQPFHQNDSISPVVMACGRCLLGRR